ncbi:MAG: hypothetical protein ACXWXL_22380, partial [Candidatus Binatia bacterium]
MSLVADGSEAIKQESGKDRLGKRAGKLRWALTCGIGGYVAPARRGAKLIYAWADFLEVNVHFAGKHRIICASVFLLMTLGMLSAVPAQDKLLISYGG